VNQWNEIIQQSEFQWMPTEILFDAAGRGKIMTDINNEIKRQRYPEIFGYFEKLLEQMAPGFQKVSLSLSSLLFSSFLLRSLSFLLGLED
jgi:hypothetical protein